MKKRTFAVLLALCCLLTLCACAKDAPAISSQTATPVSSAPESSAPVSSAEETSSSQPEATPTPTPAPVSSAASEAEGTIIRLRAAVQIFTGPSYDEAYVQCVGEDGAYTIMDTQEDTEGNTWGKLKSGLGWVNLTEALDDDFAEAAVNADVITDKQLENLEYTECFVSFTPYAQKIGFWTYEPLTDFVVTTLEFTDGGYQGGENVCMIDTVEKGALLVFGLEFPGDMTAYGVTFTEADGEREHYRIYLSGRNGALVFEEVFDND